MLTNYKKNSLLLFFCLLFLTINFILFLSESVLARDLLEIDYPEVPGVTKPTTAKTPLPNYIAYVFRLSLWIGTIIVVGSLIYGGFLYISSAASPGLKQEAKKQIFSSILGLLILFSSHLLMSTLNPQLVKWEVEETDVRKLGSGIILTLNGKEEHLGISTASLKKKFPHFFNPDGTPLGTIYYEILNPEDIIVTVFESENYREKGGSKVLDIKKGDILPYTGSIQIKGYGAGVYLRGEEPDEELYLINDLNSIPPELEGKITSIEIKNKFYEGKYTDFTAVLHKDPGFKGGCEVFMEQRQRGIHQVVTGNLPWNDPETVENESVSNIDSKVSSVNVFQIGEEENCNKVTLYGEPGYKGEEKIEFDAPTYEPVPLSQESTGRHKFNDEHLAKNSVNPHYQNFGVGLNDARQSYYWNNIKIIISKGVNVLKDTFLSFASLDKDGTQNTARNQKIPSASAQSEAPLKSIFLNVPFKSQVPPGDWDLTNNCGQTCFLMIFSYYKRITPTEEGIKAIDEWLYKNFPKSHPDPILNNYNGSPMNTSEIVSLAKGYGGFPDSNWHSGWSLQKLQEELERGYPVIVAVYYPSPRDPKIYIYHFLVVTGMNEEIVRVNDSGRKSKEKGRGITFPREDFERYWAGQGNACVTIHDLPPGPIIPGKPVANAGTDQGAKVGNLVTLDGSASYDPDGDPLTFQWTQVSGPSVTLSNPKSKNPSFTLQKIGTYVFRLVVNDGTEDSLPDEVKIKASQQYIPISPTRPLSIEIDGRCLVILFDNTTKDGSHSEVFTDSVRDLRDNPIGQCSPYWWDWNSLIPKFQPCASSIAIYPLR